MQAISIEPGAAAVFAVTAIVLFFKGVMLSYLQVRWRVRGRAFERPEDARLMGLAPRPVPEVVQRATDAWRNELENAPAFLSLSAGYVLLGGAASPLLWASSAFVGFRCFQAFAHVKALQPHRTIGFLGGVLASIFLAALTGIRVWSSLS